jgi:cyclohexyl-isocyanide hydratase
MNRRDALKTLSISIGAGALASEAITSDAQKFDPLQPPAPGSHPRHDMRAYAIPTTRQVVIILIYPGVNLLELASAQQVFARMGNTDMHLVWKTKESISTDTDVTIQASEKFSEVEDEPFILHIPGGSNGLSDVLTDKEVLSYLAKKARKAAYITASGSGTLLAAAAGLLTGYQAAGHWMTRDLLKMLGAKPQIKRVVKDRNRITSAGGAGALDLALFVTSTLRNANMTAALTLANEYAPAPISGAGTPQSAPQAVTQMEWAMNARLRDELREAITALKVKK